MTSRVFFDSIPVELHAHKAKVQFFLEELRSFTAEKNIRNDDVRVLEIGCGNGTVVTLPIAELGYTVTGVDLHEPSIALANSKNCFKNADFLCKDLTELAGDQVYDVVILSDILEHVESPSQLMSMAAGFINQNGLILISIPNGFGPSELERKFLEFFKIDKLLNWLRSIIAAVVGRNSDAYNADSGHIQFFKMKEIEALISASNLILAKKRKGALFGGGITYPLGTVFPWIVKPSLRLAQKLPFEAISTWYFSCRSRK